VTLDVLVRSAIVRLAPPRSGSGPFARAHRAALGGLLAALLRRRSLADVLAVLDPPNRAPAPDPAGRRVLDALRRWPTTCLWRALAGYAALRARGQDVRFVVGVRMTGAELEAHGWLEQEGAALGEAEEPRGSFAVAFQHPPAFAKELRVPDSLASRDVILTELQDGTGVLLHLGTKFYYALNRTGVAVWKRLERGVSDPHELARTVSAAFDGVAEQQARADVEALLAELRAEGLLVGGR
jgi:hypothetical protein